MKPLHIPKKKRIVGMSIKCGKCNRNVSGKCLLSGMKLYTCKHGDQHRYQSRKTVNGRTTPIKTWPKELRDINEFCKLHIAIMEQPVKVVPIDSKPMLLKPCIRMYIDFLSDVDVPSYEKKNYSKDWINQVTTYFKNILAIIPNPDTFIISEFGVNEVSIIHDHLESKYSDKTYNHYIATFRKFFAFLNKKGYNLVDPFEEVKLKSPKSRTEIIHIEEFEKLIGICTPERGVKIENSGKKKNLYKDWLPDAWRLYLYTGRRRGDLPHIKVSQVKEHYIHCIESKTEQSGSNIKLIPMTEELKSLVRELTKNLSPDDYLLAPHETNRNQVRNISSDAFTHYWRQLNIDRHVTLNSLRNTYATFGRRMWGSEFEGLIGLHVSVKTTDANYVNKEEIAKTYSGEKMFG